MCVAHTNSQTILSRRPQYEAIDGSQLRLVDQFVDRTHACLAIHTLPDYTSSSRRVIAKRPSTRHRTSHASAKSAATLTSDPVLKRNAATCNPAEGGGREKGNTNASAKASRAENSCTTHLHAKPQAPHASNNARRKGRNKIPKTQRGRQDK